MTNDIWLENLKSSLQKKYQIDHYSFLEDLEGLPSSTLYKSIANLKQDEFKDNYRFVFFNFSPIQNETLDHLLKTLAYIDIPLYFVLIITNQIDTKLYLKNTADVSINLINVNFKQTKTTTHTPIFNNKRNLCPHPWVGFHVLAGGEVSPCCEYKGVITNDAGVPFNINTDSFENILYSNYMNNLRREFREGTDPTGCEVCWSSELSRRKQLSPYRLSNVYGNIDWESEGKQEYLGGHIGNLCNFGCVICNEHYSSIIAAEYLQSLDHTIRKQHPSYKILKTNQWPSRNTEFWNRVKSKFHQIKNFELLGGEPFLLEENLELIKDLIKDNLAKDVVLQLTTNGSKFPDVCNLLHYFKRTEITFSIDNLDKKFEYERYHSSWQTLLEVISKFFTIRNKSPNIKLNVCITVSILNVYDLPETIAWVKSQNFDNYYVNFVDDPKELSLNYLTKTAQESLLSKLSNHNDIIEISSVINIITRAELSDGKKFCDYIKGKEKLRKNSLLDSHREISGLMGYK